MVPEGSNKLSENDTVPGEQKLQIQDGCQMEIWTIGLWTVGWLHCWYHLTITVLNIRWMTTLLTAVPQALWLSCFGLQG